MPKIFGILLILGCCGYIVSFVGNTMMLNYGETMISRFATLPAAFGEIGTCLWFLLRGLNEKGVEKAFKENIPDENHSVVRKFDVREGIE